MSPSVLLPLVAKFPYVSPKKRALLLEWARETSLIYGEWKPFKKLFKTVEAALNDGEIDIELMGVLLHRIDEEYFDESEMSDPSTLWKAVENTKTGQKAKSVKGGGFTYTVDSRIRGWRLVISSDEKKGLISALRKTLGLTEQDNQAEPQTITFN